MIEPRNRNVTPDPSWRLPVVPPEGSGIVFRSCGDRRDPITLPVWITRLLRQGSEARLCFACGPDGSVYHPDQTNMAGVLQCGLRLMTQYGAVEPDPPTPAELADFDRQMRRAFGMEAI